MKRVCDHKDVSLYSVDVDDTCREKQDQQRFQVLIHYSLALTLRLVVPLNVVPPQLYENDEVRNDDAKIRLHCEDRAHHLRYYG